MIEVIDNFLGERDFNNIKSIINYAPNFPWYYSKLLDFNKWNISNGNALYNQYFIHKFYEDGHAQSEFLSVLDPLLQKLEPVSVIRIRANLYVAAEKLVVHGMHLDLPFFREETTRKIMTCVLYLEDNDGKTVFEIGEEVQSKANRAVFFPANLRHSSTNCTTVPRRTLINMLYISQ